MDKKRRQFLGKAHVYPHDDTSPRMRPFPGTLLPSLYGSKLGHLLREAKEEHTMLPVKQPPSLVLLGAAQKHLATCKAYVPPVPL
jgi:hypothetical protein